MQARRRLLRALLLAAGLQLARRGLPHLLGAGRSTAPATPTPSPDTFTWTVDTAAPQSTILTHPNAISGSAAADFTFSGSDPGGSGVAGFECKLDAGSFGPCSSPQAYSLARRGLPHLLGQGDRQRRQPRREPRQLHLDGRHRRPADGDRLDPAQHHQRPDPDASPSTPPSPARASNARSITGTADFHPCSSPFTPSALSDGDYTFRVRAIDPAGNTDPSAATEDFTVDTALPDAPTISAISPASPANENNPTVKGTTGAGSPTQVKIYKNAACAGTADATGTVAEFTGAGISVNVADDSTTTISAKVTGPAGDSSCSNSVNYTEDSTAPNTTITSAPPSSTGSTDATFAFTSTEPGTQQCSLDGGAFQACSSPKSYSGLAVGAHTFAVRSDDAAGNTDPTPASHTWTITPQVLGESAQSPTFQLKKKLKHVKRKVLVVTVNCPEGTCSVEQAQAKLKLQGESVSARIEGPSAISAGGSAQLRAVFSKAAHNLLSQVGRGRLFLKLLVTSTNGTHAELTQSIKLRASGR